MTTSTVIISIILLIATSAFFSSSETSMMALNKYKLKHLAKKNNKKAKRSLALINKPENLLGSILIGNTFANILASALLTKYSESHFGEFGLMISTIVLTILVLIFGEIIPKSIAAIHPMKIAFPFSLPLKIILIVLYPAVITLNLVSRIILKPFGVSLEASNNESLNKEEIQTVVHESNAKLGSKNKNMLLGVLELDRILVKDVMIHHNQIEYIDLNLPFEKIKQRIVKTKYAKLVVCKDNINNIVGILDTRTINKFLLSKSELTMTKFKKIIEEPYFIPEVVSLQKQLINFQKKASRFGVVVNELGDITGIITIEDIMEEIVGEFSDRFTSQNKINKLPNNVYNVGGSATLREINRHTDIYLESEDSKTLSGFIIELIGDLPVGISSVKYKNYIFEISEISHNRIKSIKIKKIKLNS